jgi:hypothetical protein
MLDVTLVRQIARAVLANLPDIRCFQCLSLQVGVLEKDAREAAQILVVRNDFFVARAQVPGLRPNQHRAREREGAVGVMPTLTLSGPSALPLGAVRATPARASGARPRPSRRS